MGFCRTKVPKIKMEINTESIVWPLVFGFSFGTIFGLVSWSISAGVVGGILMNIYTVMCWMCENE